MNRHDDSHILINIPSRARLSVFRTYCIIAIRDLPIVHIVPSALGLYDSRPLCRLTSLTPSPAPSSATITLIQYIPSITRLDWRLNAQRW